MVDSNQEFSLLRDSFSGLVRDLAAAREEAAKWQGLCVGLLVTLAGVVVVAGVGFLLI